MNHEITASTIRHVYGMGASRYEQVMAEYWEFDRRKLIGELALESSQHVLEVGVGTGRNLAYYPEDARVTGIDFTPEMLAMAQEKRDALDHNEIELREMDAASMTFGNDSFDAALESFVLCVAPDPELVLSEVVRVTKPGARIAVFDYCRSREAMTRKWQELIAETARTVGFPAGVIVWDPLRDYEEIIEEAGLPLCVERMERHENTNPFLLACSMLLINAKDTDCI